MSESDNRMAALPVAERELDDGPGGADEVFADGTMGDGSRSVQKSSKGGRSSGSIQYSSKENKILIELVQDNGLFIKSGIDQSEKWNILAVAHKERTHITRQGNSLKDHFYDMLKLVRTAMGNISTDETTKDLSSSDYSARILADMIKSKCAKWWDAETVELLVTGIRASDSKQSNMSSSSSGATATIVS